MSCHGGEFKIIQSHLDNFTVMKSIATSKKIILLLALIATITFTACDDDIDFGTDCINGEGPIVTQTLTLPDFNGVGLSIAGNVVISQGATQEVRAIGQQNIIEDLKTTVTDDIWTITFENDCYNNYDLTIEITVPNINIVNISGSGDVTINDFSNQNALEIGITGSGNMTLNQFEGIENFRSTLTGSGVFTANEDISTLDNMTIISSGSGQFFGFEISSNNCSVNSTGSGTTEITAIESLNVVITGSGTVSYKGSPDITQNITGSGRLIDAN